MCLYICGLICQSMSSYFQIFQNVKKGEKQCHMLKSSQYWAVKVDIQ